LGGARTALLAGLVLVSLIACRESLAHLATVWSTQDAYSHGWLLGPLAVLLAGRTLLTDRFPAVRSQWLGPLLLLPAMLAWFVAGAATVQVVELAAIPLILWAIVGAVYGWTGMRVTLLPLSLLYWTIPVWDFVTAYAQRATLVAVGLLLDLFQVTAFVQGQTVFVSAGQFEIESGCSGTHYLIVASALAALYGYFYLRSPVARLAAIAVSLLFAAAMNWLRVFSIVIAGDVTDMRHFLVTVDHYWYGWGLFLLMLLPLIWVFRMIEHREAASAPPEPDHAVKDAVPAQPLYAPAVAAVFMLILFPGVLAFATDRAERLAVPELSLPESAGGWHIDRDALPDWSPQFAGVAAERTATYRAGDFSASLYQNLYTVQQQGAELINFENRLMPRSARRDTHQRVPVGAGDQPIDVIRETWSDGGRRHVVLYAYLVGDAVLTRPRDVKAAQLKMFISGRPAGGVVALNGVCRADCDAAADRLAPLLATVLRESVDE